MAREVDKLTDPDLKRWTKKGEPVAKADGRGLTFTLSPAGTAAWVLRYRFAGRPRELTLGRYPDLSLSKARDRAEQERARIQHGIDVATEHQRSKRTAADSFRLLALDYMDKAFPGLAPATVRQRRYYINGVILPKLGGHPAQDVTARDVVALLDAVGKKSGSAAEVVLTTLTGIFRHGLAKHAVTSNPCAGISVAAVVGRREPRRQRLMLTEDELRILLPALPSIGEANAVVVKLLLLTCTRIGELARAEWEHVDLDRAEWVIPDANSKTGRGFTVPLPPAAVKLFSQLKDLSFGSRYVLPARQLRRVFNHGGDTHMEVRAINAQLHKLCDKLKEVRRFTPHDLRSTARSHLAAIGVPVLVAERCLNHSLGGLVAVYDQHDYLTERRAALETWARFLAACEAGRPWKSGSKVVPMRAAVA